MNEGLFDRLEKYGFSLYMIRITLAASLSWVAVHSLYGGDRYFYFAPLAAILITQSSVKASLEKGAYRLLGIILGGIVSLIVGQFLDVGGLSILLILLIGIGIATACRIDMQAVSQVGVTSVLALTFYQDHYVLWRVAETFIGILIALAISMIIVPPKGFVKVKTLALDGSQRLAEALRGVTSGRAASSQELEQASNLLARSSRLQKELHYTLSHYKCRDRLGSMSKTTAHLTTMHAYVKEINEEIRFLPAHYAASDWMSEVVEATAECISLYGNKHLGGSEDRKELAESLRHARDLQLSCFAMLQEHSPLTTLRDLGAVFCHLNQVLEEIEQAEHSACQPVAATVRSQADMARAVQYMKRGLSQKL